MPKKVNTDVLGMTVYDSQREMYEAMSIQRLETILAFCEKRAAQNLAWAERNPQSVNAADYRAAAAEGQQKAKQIRKVLAQKREVQA